MKNSEQPSSVHDKLKKINPFWSLLFIGGVGALLALKFAPVPYAWIFFLFVINFLNIAMATYRRLPFVARVFMSFGVVTLLLGLLEIFIAVMYPPFKKDFREETSEKSLGTHDDYLGYVYRNDIKVNIKRYYRDSFIYSVTYTTNQDGLRVSPPDRGQLTEASILFFGGSFTFGGGVEDVEAMPYQTGEKLQGEYRIFNFARGGYGPHQMLSAIEHGVVAEIVDVPPRYAIFQAILPHVQRAAGHADWDRSGPFYKVGKDGRPVFQGPFANRRVYTFLFKQIRKSRIWLMLSPFRYPNLPETDLERFLAILEKSGRQLEDMYPGIEYHVIFWDETNRADFPRILDDLRLRGVRVHLISEILPDVKSISFGRWGVEIVRNGHEEPDQHYINDEYDGHPNPTAHDAIAEYIATKIIKD